VIDEDGDGLDDLDVACVVFPSRWLGWRCTVHTRHVRDRPPWTLTVSTWHLTKRLALTYAQSWRPIRVDTMDR
jgi:hypothetical protein